ncbi:Maf-like protein [Desulfosarcina ovata subsp. sediminis]|uniref:dTTP/UTP pyrophosphatase n=1 Tax=Desulfosarcina ovata subsp. sediminis TaxID=885957 RepID=A0A5K7ZC13_9BACT|nr:Maf family protein [Desulfosarcina ovata]BBO79698.1 Maf-like protein [Desulfosarcina ovata subsp. sediminis]
MQATTPQLILASQSPRRRYLLEQAGLTFQVIPSSFDEDSVRPKNPSEYVKTLATAKADEVASRYPGSWVIGADTIVTINDSILGKPADARQAREMLVRLSGQSHFVYTGYAIVCKQTNSCHCEAVQTRVQFKALSDAEIDWYIESGEPFDKAGAYAIQGLGTFLVRSIDGSYTNVVGLPVCEVIETLFKLGVVRLSHANAKEVAV